jgi:hypothetical protein
MVRRLVALASAFGLLALQAGCMTPEQIRQHDEATCAGYGFKPGTDAFAGCLQREVLARQYVLEQPYWGWHHYWH